jgi:hypothetical protein
MSIDGARLVRDQRAQVEYRRRQIDVTKIPDRDRDLRINDESRRDAPA